MELSFLPGMLKKTAKPEPEESSSDSGSESSSESASSDDYGYAGAINQERDPALMGLNPHTIARIRGESPSNYDFPAEEEAEEFEITDPLLRKQLVLRS